MPDLSVQDAMRLIQILDDSAKISFSQWTGKFFVTARIEISNGSVLRGLAEHENSPITAVFSYLEALQKVTLTSDARIVTNGYRPTRQQWYWNGVGWALDNERWADKRRAAEAKAP